MEVLIKYLDIHFLNKKIQKSSEKAQPSSANFNPGQVKENV
jgi:hypothetical protein